MKLLKSTIIGGAITSLHRFPLDATYSVSVGYQSLPSYWMHQTLVDIVRIAISDVQRILLDAPDAIGHCPYRMHQTLV